MNYVPTAEDLLRVRIRTTGVTETAIPIGPLTYEIVDCGGARSERKKWIHMFGNVDVLLFFVALDGYDSGMMYDIVSCIRIP